MFSSLTFWEWAFLAVSFVAVAGLSFIAGAISLMLFES